MIAGPTKLYLRDAYQFPGFTPSPTVVGIFGDHPPVRALIQETPSQRNPRYQGRTRSGKRRGDEADADEAHDEEDRRRGVRPLEEAADQGHEDVIGRRLRGQLRRRTGAEVPRARAES